MAYALFKDGEKLSRAFPTKEEALRKADEAGLVEDEEDGRPKLQQELKIEPCPPDPQPRDDRDLDWTPQKPDSDSGQ